MLVLNVPRQHVLTHEAVQRGEILPAIFANYGRALTITLYNDSTFTGDEMLTFEHQLQLMSPNAQLRELLTHETT